MRISRRSISCRKNRRRKWRPASVRPNRLLHRFTIDCQKLPIFMAQFLLTKDNNCSGYRAAVVLAVFKRHGR
jgi:hypothetical protein